MAASSDLVKAQEATFWGKEWAMRFVRVGVEVSEGEKAEQHDTFAFYLHLSP